MHTEQSSLPIAILMTCSRLIGKILKLLSLPCEHTMYQIRVYAMKDK